MLDDPRRTFHELTKFGSSHDKFDALPRPYYTPYPADLFFVFFCFLRDRGLLLQFFKSSIKNFITEIL